MGWLRFKPGKRDAFFAVARPFIEGARSEEGCEFFEMIASQYDPDLVVVMECFKSREAHEAHLKTPHFLESWKVLNEFCDEGTFKNIFSDHVEPDSHKFGTADTEETPTA